MLKKFLTDGDYDFVIEGNDLVLASNGEDVFDIDEHVILQVQSLMSDYEIGTLSNDDLFVLINRIKIKVINAIKGI